MTKIDYNEYIKQNTLRCEAGYRGGGIEIALDELLGTDEDHAMTAYQNYLGGGMLGRIANSYSFDPESLGKRQRARLEKVTDALNRYFHNLTNHEDDERESETYEHNQLSKPVSAY